MPPTSPSSAELSHASVGQWGSVIAGVLSGLAATILLATLGAALGLTGGAAVADETRSGMETGLAALGVAGVAWLLATAVIVGIVGGTVLARTSRPDRTYHPGILGLLAWTGGVVVASLLAAPGAIGAVAALGGGTGAAVATTASDTLRRDRADGGIANASGSGRADGNRRVKHRPASG